MEMTDETEIGGRFFRILRGENSLREKRVARNEKNLGWRDGGRGEVGGRFFGILRGGKLSKRERDGQKMKKWEGDTWHGMVESARGSVRGAIGKCMK